jgi:peptidoglycan hydrolase-like protein with peptidoglycan-binding domain
VAGTVVLTALAGGLGWLLLGSRPPAGPPAAATVSTGQAAVVRADVAQRTQFSGSLGHAGAYTVISPATGALTRSRAVGDVVRQGQSLYEVDGRPVMLLYGERPVWRAFSRGMSDGADVQQLQAALKALGYGSRLRADQHFSTGTAGAVRRWQAAAGLPVTGAVPLGQVVFLPEALRITGHSVELGAMVQPGTPVQTGTTDRQVVFVQLPPADLPTTRLGDPVLVLLSDGHTQRQGRIVAIGVNATTAGSGSPPGNGNVAGQSTVQVDIAVDGAIAGFIEQAQVQVFITAELHRDVLTVPIVSLRALPGGRYEVVVVSGGPAGHIPVSVGLIDDIAQVAEVSGPGLTEGLRVEVPSGTS